MSYTPTEWESTDVVTATRLNALEQAVGDLNMSYTPNVWQNGDILTADQMNALEQAVASGGGGGIATVPVFTYVWEDDYPEYTCNMTYSDLASYIDTSGVEDFEIGDDVVPALVISSTACAVAKCFIVSDTSYFSGYVLLPSGASNLDPSVVTEGIFLDTGILFGNDGNFYMEE